MNRRFLSILGVACLAALWLSINNLPVTTSPAAHAQDAHGHEAEPASDADDHEQHNHSESINLLDNHEDHDEGDPAESVDDHAGNDPDHPEVTDHTGHTHGESSGIALSEQALGETGIRVAAAGPGTIDSSVILHGEIRINTDRMAHITPKISGIVQEVRVTLGDRVSRGDVLAVLDSRELADNKAEYLAARERYELAQARFSREDALWKKKISSEQEYLDVRSTLAEARIAKRSAEQKLNAIGLDAGYLEKLDRESEAQFTQYSIRAPADGVIIDKAIVTGENLDANTIVFTVADLSTVWADLHVYQKDLVHIRKGLTVRLTDSSAGTATGTVIYVAPIVDEQTRTALVRVAIDNDTGAWRPGVFVTGRLVRESTPVSIVVPRHAVQILNDAPVVFMSTESGYKPAPVITGRADTENIEIISGLAPGQQYVSHGAFDIKAAVITSTMDSHAGHGH